MEDGTLTDGDFEMMTRAFALTLLSTALLTGMPALAQEGGVPGAPDGNKPPISAEQKAQMEATREKIKSAMDKIREDGKATMEKVHALKQEARALLQAETFDKGAFLAKHKEIEALMTSMHQARANAMADLAASLSPQERQMLGRHLGGKGGHPGMHRGGDSMGKMPMMEGGPRGDDGDDEPDGDR